jgi:hypothetical protein
VDGALQSLIELSDLEERLARTFEGPDVERAQSVLDEASALVRAESGKDWVSPDDPTKIVAPTIVRFITLRVAERAIRNPDGFSAETAGDYSYQRNGVAGEGSLYVTDRERKLLLRAAGKRQLWTQPVTRGRCFDDTVWLEDSFGCELFPVDRNYGC